MTYHHLKALTLLLEHDKLSSQAPEEHQGEVQGGQQHNKPRSSLQKRNIHKKAKYAKLSTVPTVKRSASSTEAVVFPPQGPPVNTTGKDGW